MANAPEDPEQPGGFLQRWSTRKSEAAEAQPTPAQADALNPNSPSGTSSSDTVAPEATTESPAVADTPPVTEADLENLTYDSDYTKFMGEHVPEALRRRALRQLWRSDPILANVDGLCDYDDDYTDAALAVKVLKTAHKVGQGYLTDEEVAANRALGDKPAEKEVAVAAPELDEDDAEDMDAEDVDYDDQEAETESPAATTSAEATQEESSDAEINADAVVATTSKPADPTNQT